MRVWFINQYALTPASWGGTRHFSLARELQRLGHEVFIIASDSFRPERRLPKGENSRLADENGVPFLWLRTPPSDGSPIQRIWNMTQFAAATYCRVAIILLRPDVVIGSTPHLFAALAAERLAVRLGVPFVLEVRDLWPQTIVELAKISSRHPFIVLLARIERFLYARASRILTLLPGAAEHVILKGADPEKVVWLPNGIDFNLVPPAEPLIPHDGPLTIMYAGAHGIANGLDIVLDAARLLKSEGWEKRVRFHLVGDGPEKTNLMQRASAMRLGSVVFADPVPKRNMYAYLAKADAFLMVLRHSPIFRFGVSPNKLFDFMASARPIVYAIDTPYNPVEAAGAGLTATTITAEAIADAVKRLAQTSFEERRLAGLRGRRYVEKNHSLADLARRLDTTLIDVTAEAISVR